MKQNQKKSLVQREIYRAIAHFIERQHLVAQAMQELGLDLEEVGKWGAAAWASSQMTDESTHFDQITSEEMYELLSVVKRAKDKKLPQSGSWGDEKEWNYFLHGGGCRLHNVYTGEVIDWNCPHVLIFDPYFFIEHLRWRISRHNDNELQHTLNWIQEHPEGLNSVITLIEEMIDNE